MQQFCLDITVINSCIYALCVSCLCHLHNTAKHKDHLSIVLFLKSYSKFPPPPPTDERDVLTFHMSNYHEQTFDGRYIYRLLAIMIIW